MASMPETVREAMIEAAWLMIAERGLEGMSTREVLARTGAPRGSVSDIVLPDLLARTIPVWSTALLVIAGLLHVRRFGTRPDRQATSRSRPVSTSEITPWTGPSWIHGWVRIRST